MAEIVLRVKEAGSIKDRMIGLIGIRDPHGLHLKTRFGIHTCGLNFPIDVLVLNRDKKVVKIKKILSLTGFFYGIQCILK